MRIKKIELKDFRNYGNKEIEFHPNVNLILGKNAQGKTNLLESIYITSLGKSFRTNKLVDLIRFDKQFCYVKVETEKEDFDGSVEILIEKGGKKSAKVNGKKIKKASDLLKNVYIVIFSPEDLKIVKDEPEKRRKYIDRELSQINPLYYDNLANYQKILYQRNTYLKEIKIDKSILDLWDIQLAKYGSKIINQRKKFIDQLNIISGEIQKKITNDKENLEVRYAPNIKYIEDIKEQENYFYQILKSNFENDLRQRTTTKGPHKDDLEFYINQMNVKNFGSQGQQRTTSLSLKLAEIKIIKQESGENPVLLLDDVMSELDLERQEYLVKTLSDVQLFITTTEIQNEVLKELPKGEIYNIKNGEVIKEKY